MDGEHGTGAVEGGVRRLLRAEGLALLSCAAALYWRAGSDWKQFAILFLAVQPSLDNLQASIILLSIARVGALVATTLAVLDRVRDNLSRIDREDRGEPSSQS